MVLRVKVPLVWRKSARVWNERTKWKGLTNRPNPSVADGKDRQTQLLRAAEPNDSLEAYTGGLVSRKRESHTA